MNNNNLETHEKITLNKDDNIFFRRITNFSYVANFPLQYHLLNKFICVEFMYAFLFCSLPWAANACIVMRGCYMYVIILVQCNLLSFMDFEEFENIVISPADNYRFLNFIPINCD